MFNIHKDANENYLAKFVTINNLIPHPKADRLQISKIGGNSVIVDINVTIGDKFIYFPLESAINPQLLSFANLFSDKNKNADNTLRGFFGNQCRVKALKLREIPSQGFLLPISVLFSWFNFLFNDFKAPVQLPTTEFSHYNDIQILEKYVPIESNSGSKELSPLIVSGQFSFHDSTPMLGKNIHKILPDDVINISVKLHGTSGVFSNVLVYKKLSWWQKTLRFFGAKLEETKYKKLYSSRNVIKNLHIEKYGSDVYAKVAKSLDNVLTQGMTIYGEIVGYKSIDSYIQKNFDYGCKNGEQDFYVYRITTTTSDSKVIEWSALQIKEWVEQNGLKTPPILYYGQAKNLFPEVILDENWNESFLNKLNETYLETDEPMCVNKVPREGICLRVEGLENKTYKYKSFKFYELETKSLDSGEVDIETIESI